MQNAFQRMRNSVKVFKGIEMINGNPTRVQGLQHFHG